MKNLTHFLFVLAFVILLSAGSAAQDNIKKWETFNYGKQKALLKDLQKLELENLQNVRGVVFGRHGRIFKEKSIQEYLEKHAWYKPNPRFVNSLLNQMERGNIDLIRQAEAEKHDSVQPGDLRFWQKQPIPEDKIYANTAAEWRVMIAEIEAIHGKTFPDEPWLQTYFEERYWYKANPDYSAAVLSEIEHGNIETITKKRESERHVAVSPGDMDKFQNVLLTEKMLEGATISELRIMRNEFDARHGKKFVTPGYRSFFEFQEWYRPIKDQSKVILNNTEKKNVETILRVENRLREEIAKKPKTADDFSGLFTEDLRLLRNEIYARHGRIFKTKVLNDYFSEQSWYKPDPSYSDSMLTAIESENLKAIKEAEDAAVSKFSEVEG
ncbi:MAG: YARHG domain-containing protein [Pyrinomonadaceae bacterium]